jgi:uncharacterized membrane protein
MTFRGYLGALVVFLLLDGIWLGVVATDFYFSALGDLVRKPPNWIAAGVFYLAYIAGVVHFAVAPAGSFASAGRNGALLGLLCYGTYDMTNLATLNGWPVEVAIVDIVWGGVITGSAAVGGFLASGRRRA